MTERPLHGRLPWRSPEELDASAQLVYQAITGGDRATQAPFVMTSPDGRLEGPFNAMLYAPRIGHALQALGGVLRFRGSLSDRSREISILTLAAVRQSEFEWYAHEAVGALLGLTRSEMSAIRNFESAESFSQGERLIQEATLELLTGRQLQSQTFEDLVKVLGFDGVQELITLVGYYDVLALIMNVWQTPLPGGVPGVFPDAHPGP